MLDGRALVKDMEGDEAGQALKAKGFRAVHQGGGLVNFEGVRGDKLLTVVAAGCSHGPRKEVEPVDVLQCPAGDPDAEPGEEGTTVYASLREFLATLK